MSSQKNFDSIVSPYEFFQSHSTEKEVLSLVIAGVLANQKFRSFLDFGGGSGEFTEEVFSKGSVRADSATLVEPAVSYHSVWKEKLAKFSEKQTALDSPVNGQEFDLIISNHALYYVTNLYKSLAFITDSLAGGGVAYLSMASESNELIMMWRLGFLSNGQKVPYFLTGDLEAVLKGLSRKYSITSYHSDFSCTDNEENRTLLLKFLFGSYLPEFSAETLKNLNHFLDARSSQSSINLKLNDCIYSLKGDSQ
ncbi:MAG: methyltransferase domain-containing protein [Xanthomonadaceae bacterium]|nr:methyltransferase domain-containing protein [Xanthomonadaceae bacterium]